MQRSTVNVTVNHTDALAVIDKEEKSFETKQRTKPKLKKHKDFSKCVFLAL